VKLKYLCILEFFKSQFALQIYIS